MHGAAARDGRSRGYFVSLEGIDGCGKTTQVRLLSERLARDGHEPLLAREPGGTEIGDLIRSVLLSKAQLEMQPMTELLLFFASRAENAAQIIRPALRNGRIVVCDRFTDASVAYQGHGRGLGPGTVGSLGTLVLGGLQPDLTIWLDVPLATARLRASGRSRSQGSDTDRMESQGVEFFRRVHQGYSKIATEDPSRVKRVDASGNQEEVARTVYQTVVAALKKRGLRAQPC